MISSSFYQINVLLNPEKNSFHILLCLAPPNEKMSPEVFDFQLISFVCFGSVLQG